MDPCSIFEMLIVAMLEINSANINIHTTLILGCGIFLIFSRFIFLQISDITAVIYLHPNIIHIGTNNKLEFVEEVKLEFVCDIANVKTVLKNLREVHPYEEPAIDIVPILNESVFN